MDVYAGRVRTSACASSPRHEARLNVETEHDLGRLRRSVTPLRHDDERLASRVVTLLRDGSTISRIACATESFAFDVLRICAGIRYRTESAAAWLASEALPLFAAAA